MDHIDKIARMLTEDPDIFESRKQVPKKKKKYVVEVSKKPILEEKKNKKEPSNKPDEEVFGKEFRALLGLEDKPEPADPSKKDRNQKSPNNELDGAEQPENSPYLKEAKARKKKKCGRCDFDPPLEWSEAEEYGLCARCSEEL